MFGCSNILTIKLGRHSTSLMHRIWRKLCDSDSSLNARWLITPPAGFTRKLLVLIDPEKPGHNKTGLWMNTVPFLIRVKDLTGLDIKMIHLE